MPTTIVAANPMDISIPQASLGIRFSNAAVTSCVTSMLSFKVEMKNRRVACSPSWFLHAPLIQFAGFTVRLPHLDEVVRPPGLVVERTSGTV